MFKATITGNLGRDPEQRTVGGQTLTTFSVAVRTARKDKATGTYATEWIVVNLWGKRGDFWNSTLKTGNKIMAIGDLSHTTYVNKEGKTVNLVELTCTDIENLTPRDEQSASAEGNGDSTTRDFAVTEDELPF